jgi:hypothetical protein
MTSLPFFVSGFVPKQPYQIRHFERRRMSDRGTHEVSRRPRGSNLNWLNNAGVSPRIAVQIECVNIQLRFARFGHIDRAHGGSQHA